MLFVSAVLLISSYQWKCEKSTVDVFSVRWLERFVEAHYKNFDNDTYLFLGEEMWSQLVWERFVHSTWQAHYIVMLAGLTKQLLPWQMFCLHIFFFAPPLHR